MVASDSASLDFSRPSAKMTWARTKCLRTAECAGLANDRGPRQTTTPLIVKLLSDSDPTVAMRALHTIAEGGVEMVPALTVALEQKEPAIGRVWRWPRSAPRRRLRFRRS